MKFLSLLLLIIASINLANASHQDTDPAHCIQNYSSSNYKVHVLAPISVSPNDADVWIQSGKVVEDEQRNLDELYIKIDTEDAEGEIPSNEYSVRFAEVSYFYFPRLKLKIQDPIFENVKLYLPDTTGCITFEMFNSVGGNLIRLEFNK